MSLRPGDCFQLVGDGYHLKVVATFPDQKGEVVVFGLTDVEHVEERLCVFEPGDHPFFVKPTAVNYRRKIIVPAAKCNEALIKRHERLNPALLERLLREAHNSEDIEPFILRRLPRLGAELSEFLERVAAIK